VDRSKELSKGLVKAEIYTKVHFNTYLSMYESYEFAQYVPKMKIYSKLLNRIKNINLLENNHQY